MIVEGIYLVYHISGSMIHLSLTFSFPNFSPYHFLVAAAEVPSCTAVRITVEKMVLLTIDPGGAARTLNER